MRSALAATAMFGQSVRVTQKGEHANEPRVSVLLDRPDFLAALSLQTLDAVELITWNDATWHVEVEKIAAVHAWPHRRVATQRDAVATALGRYVVGWGASDAAPSALSELADAADLEPETRGALAANFDPVILWRRDEFFAKTGRKGLAQAHVYAFDGGGGTIVYPM